MNSLTRWDPFSDMRRVMDRLFDEGYSRPWRLLAADEEATMPVDISENEREVEIKASLPGVNPDEINISVQNDVLTIRGEHREETEDKDDKKQYHRREVRYGSFVRSIALPSSVDPDNAQAEFKNGMLQLKLPKSEAAKPRQIKVSSGNEKMIEGSAETKD